MNRIIQAVTGAADGEALAVKQFPDTAYQKYFVVLVVTAVAAPLHRPQLGEFLFPVAQHMRFDATQFADFANREVTLGGNGRLRLIARVPRTRFHHKRAPPRPSVSGWREK